MLKYKSLYAVVSKRSITVSKVAGKGAGGLYGAPRTANMATTANTALSGGETSFPSALSSANAFTLSKASTIDSPQFEPFDKVYGGTSSRDVMNLWSLLEACLHNNLMDRAQSILQNLAQIKKLTIDDVNKYLVKLSETSTKSELEKYVLFEMRKIFPDIKANDKTIAVLIHKALASAQESRDVYRDVQQYLNFGEHSMHSICSNVDVLTVSDFMKMIKLKIAEPEHLLRDVRSIVEASLGESAGEPSEPSAESVEPVGARSAEAFATAVLPKSQTELRGVDTFGLKAIRHTLLGLSLSEAQLAKLQAGQDDAKDVDAKDVDLFEMYKSLPPEQQPQFEELLEELNQERQRFLELRAVDAARERWRHDFEANKERGSLNIQKNLNIRLWQWYNAMLPLLQEEIKRCLVPKKGARERNEYAPYLSLVSPEKMCVITILELLKLNSTGGVIEGMRTARAVISVGKAIEMEFRSEQLLKSETAAFKDINRKSPEFKKMLTQTKTAFRTMAIEESKILWPQEIRAKVGSILISLLIHVAKVPVVGKDPITGARIEGEAPAFSHGYQYHAGSKLGVLKIHKALVTQLSGDKLTSAVQPQMLPMLVKPRPWTSWNSGGYHYTQSTLIRSKDSPEQVAYLKAVSQQGAIDQVYAGLNVLGETAWTVNKRIYNVMSEIWNSGEKFLDIPGIQDTLVLTPQPPREADPQVHREWKLENKRRANEFSSNRSDRCSANYKLEIARAFLGEKLYFPHNLDFRGRAYPLSPHFNHLGNDMSRGLLMFWRGKQLGPSGLKWLKVHLSNLFGFDKAPFEERVRFTEEHINDIIDSATNPLSGNGWWKTADKPWQALATCFELSEALQMDKPEEYISHMPVHQDGTCNGLQHYAALGGDIEGATQVNLVPSDRPQDVYSYVAGLVVKRLEKEAAKGDQYALQLKDKIKRKIVKQTVMTNVYGVTYVGATLQIDKQLSDLFDHTESYQLSKYLAKHVFASVRELFEGAHLIQDWLGECARRVTKSVRIDVEANKPTFMSSVIWTTPLGLPIVQPYRELSKKQVATNLQTIFIKDPFSVNPVNSRRQQAGFPPNFIHSLDASHMLLSAVKCGEAKLDFAAVHDSYWTHAADIDTMNTNLRDEFISLHEVDLIERLKNEFDERYKDYLQVVKIDRNSELAVKIGELKKQLAKDLGRPITLADELYLEKKRRSTDPELVTTVSLAEGVNVASMEKSDGIPIMIPLTLPPIPPKGEFDVKELKNSKYFFS